MHATITQEKYLAGEDTACLTGTSIAGIHLGEHVFDGLASHFIPIDCIGQLQGRPPWRLLRDVSAMRKLGKFLRQSQKERVSCAHVPSNTQIHRQQSPQQSSTCWGRLRLRVMPVIRDNATLRPQPRLAPPACHLLSCEQCKETYNLGEAQSRDSSTKSEARQSL